MSVLNVVATIDTPISHHGADRPEVNNSAGLDRARRIRSKGGTRHIKIVSPTIAQSMAAMRMLPPHHAAPQESSGAVLFAAVKSIGETRRAAEPA
ncbi:MAG: hypothetical protein KA118_08925 [Verrucomicrobia bacterium]|nr:hypothetical protein [Verrucomicrobiota bacterium]